MNNFDSANIPFKQYINGKVKTRDLSRTLAEFELKTDFKATESAIRKIYMRRSHGRPEDRDQTTGELLPISKLIPTNLKIALDQLTERESFWMESLYVSSQDLVWSLFSETGAKLFQQPSSASEFRNVAVNVVDVIGWLDTTNQSELALALTSKRDVTVRNLQRQAGSVQPEVQRKANANYTWPWGRHNTNLLEVLAAVAEKHWRLYTPLDETTHPVKKEVVKAIVADHGVSVHVASMMYTILRADEHPKGRPPTYKTDE